MKIKELQKTVNIAWSPAQQQQILLAAGTAAQQFDSNVNSTLELYSPNFSDATYDLELRASVSSQYKFQKLIWSPVGPHPSGLIVGGCEAGQINIYSADKLLAGKEDPLLKRQDKHTGAVSGLDFNPFQNNLLASCASESEILIWDLNNPETSMSPGAKTQPLEDVKNVAWNRQVQHILASVFSTRCVIWDLRKSQQIIKLSDSQSRVRWHAIEWHPEAATQVWLASEDDQAPVVQLWDLRYATAPAKTYQIHERGVLGMSWCLQDNDLMVSCGKDNRIYCWNPNTKIPEGEILSEVATTASWYSDVQFCPRNPALIASASLEGAVSIYSLHGGTHHLVQTANKIADSFPGMDQFSQEPIPQQATQVVYHDLAHAPKWMKRPCGVAFGFGGKLVSFNGTSKTVKVQQLTTESALVERANALERSLVDANYLDYCRQRADETPDQHGRYIWYFIKANFELNPKEEMLNLLGYNKDDIDSKFNKYIKETDGNSHSDVDTLTTRISTLTHSDSSEVECDQSTNYSTDNSTQDNKFDVNAIDSQNHNDFAAPPRPQFKIPSGDHSDSLIAEAILTGNVDAAVELCLEAQRIPEALIIASTAGIETLTRTQTRYLLQQKNELSQVISALVSRDWLDFVNRCTVDSWKEALVAALKHSERKVVDICERLGDRLLSECASSAEFTRNAMLCYICAGSIDKLVTAWYQLKRLEQQNPGYKPNTAELQDLAEMVMLMCKSLEQQGISVDLAGRFAGFLTEYGGLLASQGALTAALQYITTLGGGAASESDVLQSLRERINNAVNLDYSQPAAVAAAPLSYQQQRNRGSFSQPQPSVAMPYGQPPNQYAQPSWPTQVPPLQTAYPGAQLPPPQIFNPQPVKPEPLAQPPRPLSNASSSGGPPQAGGASSSGGSGLSGRSKYVLDPSVAAPTSSYGLPYNPVPAPVPSAVPFGSGGVSGPVPQPVSVPTYNSKEFNTNPIAAAQPYNPSSFMPGQQNQYLPGVNPIEAMPPPAAPPIIQNVQRNPTPPPGWNDPPALKSSRVPKPKPVVEPSAAIFHPLFPVDPNQNQNGYVDPSQYQHAPPPGGVPNTYYNPGAFNNNPQQQQQSYLQPQQPPSAIPNQGGLQQQNWQGQQQTIGYTEQPAPIQQQRQPEPPKEKAPLPEEYIYLQTVLEELKNRCLGATNDPRTKRKFVDVVKRLENLYDCLRDGKLTPTTVQYLNQIVQYIQISDYANALEIHTRIAFGTDFAQCAGFMQGLKVLLQSASELQLVLR
ncbi:protein transport protein Sec31A isoform X1 [Drosophila yakuba]|uniref:protein transport protein Sec31A isoform X1 n=1 Tax=Drosophila yakuba TaxID=7245 RepID=UPI0019308080|nr:protein transport protein Sec31A isoform X1 [Drosophila yakuba]XP_039226630.1 protein transport protein Sec31A isoform X1 [Drosophila yakuba]